MDTTLDWIASSIPSLPSIQFPSMPIWATSKEPSGQTSREEVSPTLPTALHTITPVSTVQPETIFAVLPSIAKLPISEPAETPATNNGVFSGISSAFSAMIEAKSKVASVSAPANLIQEPSNSAVSREVTISPSVAASVARTNW